MPSAHRALMPGAGGCERCRGMDRGHQVDGRSPARWHQPGLDLVAWGWRRALGQCGPPGGSCGPPLCSFQGRCPWTGAAECSLLSAVMSLLLLHHHGGQGSSLLSFIQRKWRPREVKCLAHHHTALTVKTGCWVAPAPFNTVSWASPLQGHQPL
jgi:hypothetical protein